MQTAPPKDRSLATAKAELIQAAERIDPLAMMRTHPYATVAVALGTGAILSLNPVRLAAAQVLTQSITSLVRLVMTFAKQK